MISGDTKSQVAVAKMASEPAETTKILVIDDDVVSLKTLTGTLNREGYNVFSARSGAEAVGIVRNENPDLLVVDVNLFPDGALEGVPNWDGFQVTRWLRHVSAKMIPAIIISADDKPDYQKYAEKIGAGTFMSKPLNAALLLQSIQSALPNRMPNNQNQTYA
jgi:DNA-binding response OmpR family regulator